MTLRELAKFFDHTLLKADATTVQIEQLCREAKQYHFASVCVNPLFVPVAANWLMDTAVRVCTVAGFPLGATTLNSKMYEAHESIARGAGEVDMVIAIGLLKQGDARAVEEEVREIARACHDTGAILKVILECALLTESEKRTACRLCVHAGADFVKTSTGFGPGGATVSDVRLMSEEVKSAGLGVKAAGGIRTLADAQAMIAAGATRLGASASVAIFEEARAGGQYSND